MNERKERSVVHIGLGANLGDRTAAIERAFRALDDLPATTVVATSSLYRTEPRIVEDQPDFINACATIETAIRPCNLLDALLAIESDFGRERARDKGPRQLDLDILLWEDRVIDREQLTIPHHGLADRAFVLVPLAEIAGDAHDPRSGCSVSELLEQCPDDGGVERLDAPARD